MCMLCFGFVVCGKRDRANGYGLVAPCCRSANVHLDGFVDPNKFVAQNHMMVVWFWCDWVVSDTNFLIFLLYLSDFFLPCSFHEQTFSDRSSKMQDKPFCSEHLLCCAGTCNEAINHEQTIIILLFNKTHTHHHHFSVTHLNRSLLASPTEFNALCTRTQIYTNPVPKKKRQNPH